jgi:hypothetical protein
VEDLDPVTACIVDLVLDGFEQVMVADGAFASRWRRACDKQEIAGTTPTPTTTTDAASFFAGIRHGVCELRHPFISLFIPIPNVRVCEDFRASTIIGIVVLLLIIIIIVVIIIAV